MLTTAAGAFRYWRSLIDRSTYPQTSCEWDWFCVSSLSAVENLADTSRLNRKAGRYFGKRSRRSRISSGCGSRHSQICLRREIPVCGDFYARRSLLWSIFLLLNVRVLTLLAGLFAFTAQPHSCSV